MQGGGNALPRKYWHSVNVRGIFRLPIAGLIWWCGVWVMTKPAQKAQYLRHGQQPFEYQPNDLLKQGQPLDMVKQRTCPADFKQDNERAVKRLLYLKQGSKETHNLALIRFAENFPRNFCLSYVNHSWCCRIAEEGSQQSLCSFVQSICWDDNDVSTTIKRCNQVAIEQVRNILHARRCENEGLNCEDGESCRKSNRADNRKESNGAMGSNDDEGSVADADDDRNNDRDNHDDDKGDKESNGTMSNDDDEGSVDDEDGDDKER
ncbi:hypothetical protein RJ035_006644 [Blastomyces gilchristii]